MLTIRLLGAVEVCGDGEPVAGFDAPRLQSLLAYLVLQPGVPQPRARVAAALWPESNESQAKTNLRQLLHHLRRVLPEPDRFLQVDTQAVGWRPDAPCRADVWEVEQAVACSQAAAELQQKRQALEDAVDRCGGDLLPGCYEEWLLPERERFRQIHLDVLEQLTEVLEAQRDHPAAIRSAQELLRHDPLHEATYRRLMRLHALIGERARALRVYHACATTLERELGVEPTIETQEVHRSLLQHAEASSSATGREPPGIPLIGREPEWATCLDTFREFTPRRTHILLVRGEAGIGKTRLVEEIEQWSSRQGHHVASARAYAAEGHLAYAPLVEWLRGEPLHASVRSLDDVWLAELARLLPELRAEHPDLPAPRAASSTEERQRLFHALARALVAFGGPVLAILDDVQWCDRETLEFLHFLARSDHDTPLLVLLTVRPEEVDVDHPVNVLARDLQRLGMLTSFELGPLDTTQVGELARCLRGRATPEDEAAALHRATGGNPLFVVETVREELSRSRTGPAAGGAATTPSKVQAVIERRLGQLSPDAREVAGLAGMIGREFSIELLQRASDRDEARLVEVLDELWRRRIVREHGTAAYDFVHDRIREVAAGLVGPARARVLHRRVAAALEELPADDPDAVSASIGRHREAAGEVEAALVHYRRGAAHAHRVSALDRGAALLRRALRLLDQLPEGSERDALELELQTELGVPLVALEGYGGPGATAAYRRARELCERLGRPVAAPVLRGLALGAITRAELSEAAKLARELLTVEGADGDGLLEVEGHYLLGVISFWWADFAASRSHLEQAIERYDPATAITHARLYAQDPKVVCLVRLAYTLWHLGEPDRSRTLRDQALALAEAFDDPTTSAYALHYACWVANELGDTDGLDTLATALAALAAEHGFTFWQAMARILTGWVEVLAGANVAGIAAIREGLTTVDETGQRLHNSYALALLARSHLRADDPAAARLAVDDALELGERTGQRYLDAELLRLRGCSLAELGDHELATAELDRALTVATVQGTRGLALRAATTRARHRREVEHDHKEAIADLTEIRRTFGDAHDTADLRVADRLLQQERDS